MNSAIMQGAAMATSHGIARLNRHNAQRQHFHIPTANRLFYQLQTACTSVRFFV